MQPTAPQGKIPCESNMYKAKQSGDRGMRNRPDLIFGGESTAREGYAVESMDAGRSVKNRIELTGESPRKQLVAALLCFFLGLFGVHRYYVGRYFSGIFQLITFGGLGLWTLLDFLLILTGQFTDSKGRDLS